MFFAQSRNFFNRGKYSASIIKPGIPKTQPWKTGIRPPIIPIKTRRTPKVILNECLIIYILVIKLSFKSILYSFIDLSKRCDSKKVKIKLFINLYEVENGRSPTSITYLIIGKYKTLDRIIKFIIIILALSTLTATLIAGYEFEMNINFNQKFPIDTTGIIFLIAFMGWMPAPLDVSVWHSIWALEKKKTIKNYSLKNSMFDFNVGYIGTAILGICFICLGYFVMYGTGETFSESAGAFSNQLIEMYTKSLGNWSYYIIGIAAFSTMLSTTITTLDASPRAMSETTELIFNKKNNYGYLIWLAILALGTIIIFFVFSSQMGLLIKIATILSFLTAPFYATMNYLLISSKHTPKKNRPSKKMHILSILGIIYLLGFSVFFLLKGV